MCMSVFERDTHTEKKSDRKREADLHQLCKHALSLYGFSPIKGCSLILYFVHTDAGEAQILTVFSLRHGTERGTNTIFNTGDFDSAAVKETMAFTH